MTYLGYLSEEAGGSAGESRGSVLSPQCIKIPVLPGPSTLMQDMAVVRPMVQGWKLRDKEERENLKTPLSSDLQS